MDRFPLPPLLARVETGQPGSNPVEQNLADAPSPHQVDLHQNRWHGTWLAASPSLLGFNQEALETSVNKIGRMNGVYSLILVRNGYLIVEQYFREGYRTKPHNMKSASKSVLSALIGIARDEGLLRLDLPISDILPGVKDMNDPRKADITVEHLLTMTTGLKPTSYQAYNSWVLNGDWVKAALDQPLVADPGTHFQYSTGNTHLLSAILTTVTGMSTKEFAIQKLFGPMNITIHGWDTDPKGVYQGGNNLLLVPRDMARIGQLYLDGGKYRGRQLVPKRWVDASTRAGAFGKNEVYGSYGYLWFSRPGGNDAFVAVGFGGQYIYVSRQHKCVIAVTATLESKGRMWEKHLFDLIQDGIFGSIQSDPLPVLRLAGLKGVNPLQDRGPAAATTGRPDQGGTPLLLYPISQTTRNVILRRKPSRQSRRLGLVPAGTRVDIVKTQGQWHQVKFNGKKGWLFSPYVNIFISENPDSLSEAARLIAYEGNLPKPSSKTPAGDSDVPPAAVAVSEAGQAAVRLNLRTGPSQTDSVIRILAAGTPLEIEEKIGSWYRVRAGVFDGWVFADYVRALPEKAATLVAKRERAGDVVSETTQPIVQAPLKRKVTTTGDPLKPPARTLQDMRESSTKLETRLRSSEEVQKQLGERLEHLQEKQGLRQVRPTPPESDGKAALSELAKMREVLENQRQVILGADMARKALLDEMDGVRTQVAALNETLRRVRGLRDSQKEELLELNREITRQKTAATLAETERNRLNSALETSQSQIDSLQIALNDTASARETLGEKVSTLENSLATSQQVATAIEVDRKGVTTVLDGMRTRIQSLDDALKSAQRSGDQMKTEMAALRKDVRTQQDVNTQTDMARGSLGVEVTTTRNQVDFLRAALDESSAAREKLGAELLKVKTDLTKQLRENDRSELERKALASALDGAKTRIAALKETVLAVNARGDTTRSSLSTLSQELLSQKQAAAASSSERDGLESALAATREQVGSLQSTLEESLRETGTAQEKLSDGLSELRASLEKQGQADIQSETDRKSLVSALDGANTRIAALKESVMAMRAGRDTISAAVVALNQDLRSQKDIDTHSRSERDSIKTGLTAVTEQIGELQRNLTKVVTERKALNDRLAKVRQAIKDQHQANEQSKATRKSLISEQVWVRTQLAELSEDIKARPPLNLAMVERESESENQKHLKETAARASRERKNLKTELVAIRKRVEGFHTSLTALTAVRKDQDAEWDKVRDAIEGRQQSTILSEKERYNLKVELTAALSQIDTMQVNLNASRAKQENLDERVTTVKKTVENQRMDAVKSATDNDALLSEVDGIRTQVAALGETLRQIRTIRDNQQEEMSAMDRELQALKETNVRIVSENSRLIAELDSVKKQTGEQQIALRDFQTAREKQGIELAAAGKQMGTLQTTLRESQTVQDSMAAELTKIKRVLQEQKQTALQAETDRMTLESKLRTADKQILALKTTFALSQETHEEPPMPAVETTFDSRTSIRPSTDRVRVIGTSRASKSSRTPGAQNLPHPSSPDFDALEDFARSWADAWQGQRLKTYLAHYSKDFEPDGGVGLAVWAQQRRKRLLKPEFIEIELQNVRKKRMGASRARVTFDQRYRSNTYADQTAKALVLRWEEDGWKILKETSH